MNQADKSKLQDILDLASEIKGFLPSTQAELPEDVLRRRAIERNLELIGEAAVKISQETKDLFPAIDWRDLIDFRIILAHNYQRVKPDSIWAAATEFLPDLVKEISKVIQQ